MLPPETDKLIAPVAAPLHSTFVRVPEMANAGVIVIVPVAVVTPQPPDKVTV